MQVPPREPAQQGPPGPLAQGTPPYARHRLMPPGIATSATTANMKSLEARIRARQKIQAQEKAAAEDLASRLNGVAVEMSVRAGEGKIYGAVTHADVAGALDQLGFDIDKRKLEMPKTVKEIGEYDIAYRAHPEVTIPMKLVVHAQK